ncbi:MAG: hypothetical protein HUJ54_02515 [Erysipelotrichaceae bacterium]|nr:hypothetical protein [Erysipelotrichaceae bacterium]
MRKLIKLLLACMLCSAAGLGSLQKLRAAENDPLTIVIPAALVTEEAVEYLNTDVVIRALELSGLFIDEDGCLRVQMPSRTAVLAKEALKAKLDSVLCSIEEEAQGAIEIAGISMDYSKAAVLLHSDEFSANDIYPDLKYFTELSVVYQALNQIPVSQIRVEASIFDPKSGEKCSSLNLMQILTRPAPPGCSC